MHWIVASLSIKTVEVGHAKEQSIYSQLSMLSTDLSDVYTCNHSARIFAIVDNYDLKDIRKFPFKLYHLKPVCKSVLRESCPHKIRFRCAKKC